MVKSAKKSLKKVSRKSAKKSLRKVSRKSAKKSLKKVSRKSMKKSTRKSTKKNIKKSTRKSTRKSTKKSSKKNLKYNVRQTVSRAGGSVLTEREIRRRIIDYVRVSNIEKIEQLLDENPTFDPNSLGYEVFDLATQNGDIEMMNFLLDIIDPNVRGIAGETILHKCIMMFAYEHSFDNPKQTIENIIKLLLEKGANPNIRNGVGNTPLHLASMKNFPPIVKLLLEKGGDKSIQNTRGQTAKDIAINKGYSDVVSLFDENEESDEDEEPTKFDPAPCQNYDEDDMVELMPFSEMNSKKFMVFVFPDKRQTRKCITRSKETLKFIRENIMANWIKNPNSRLEEMEDTGHGGMPGTERYHKIFGDVTFYIRAEDFDRIYDNRNEKRLPVYTLGNKRTIRLGNVNGIFGVSMLHGQAPGEDVYDIVDVTYI